MTEQESPSESTISKLYTEQGEAYTKFAERSYSWCYIERPLLNIQLPYLVNTNSKILDAGCGTVTIAPHLVI